MRIPDLITRVEEKLGGGAKIKISPTGQVTMDITEIVVTVLKVMEEEGMVNLLTEADLEREEEWRNGEWGKE